MSDPADRNSQIANRNFARIVITGGPGAGKTVISQRIAAAHPNRFVLVPEAATQVYAQLNTRWDKLDRAGRCDAQRRMYRLQVAQEARIAAEHPNKILLLDRGTVDGAAYWPDGAEGFWPDVGTTHAAELARYDVVLWLESCAALGLYDGDVSNACRFEDPAAAIRSGEALLDLWGDHPRIHRIGAFVHLADKFAAVMETIESL